MTDTTLLDEMVRLGIADEQLKESLDVGDPFIHAQVEIVHGKFLEKDEFFVDRFGVEPKDVCTLKNLFLEELVQEPQPVQNQFKVALEDAKRMYLFNHSPQGHFYGKLLLASIKGELDKFREGYNRNVALPQRPFKGAEKKIELSGDQKISGIELYGQKLDAIFERIRSSMLQPVYDYLAQNADAEKIREILTAQDRDYDILADQTDAERQLWNDLQAFDLFVNTIAEIPHGEHWGVSDSSGLSIPAEQFDDYISFISENGSREAADAFVKKFIDPNIEYLKRELLAANLPLPSRTEHAEIFLQDTILSHIHQNVGQSGAFEVLDELMSDQITDLEINEIRTIEQEIRENDSVGLEKKVAQKIRKAKSITYQLELSGKDPMDVRYGNESGCCIGIHEKGESIGNAYGLPHMIADNATYFFDIKQKIGENGRYRRVGIVLAYETEDEDGNRVLACNSLELSPSMTPIGQVDDVVSYVEGELENFAKENDFKAAVMSNHNYNTSRNYSKLSKGQDPIHPKLTKVSRTSEPKVYSEILKPDNTIESADGFYVIWEDDSK